MYNLHAELNTFYRDHVRLGKKRRDDLAGFRDASLTRLNNGLDKLGYDRPKYYVNQGGYIMHTLNQADGNEYDIDVALIFEEGDLPAAPLAARQRVCKALRETGDQFKEPPTPRTNAVTVWYASGQHIDFAVFRRRVDAWGRTWLEHASGDEWKPRDPDKVRAWFAIEVDTKSPKASQLATVDSEQLRRVVRFVKFLTRSRKGWNLPGGMTITTLVCAAYIADPDRDDVSLYRTLQSVRSRLAFSQRLVHPVDGSDLTGKPKRLQEVANLKALLDDLMGKLAILEDPRCTRAQARNAWRQFFNHPYWNADNDKSLLRPAAAASAPPFSFGSTPRVPTKDAGFG
jgi:hypothetical protein